MINLVKRYKVSIFTLIFLFTASACQLVQPVFNVRWATKEGTVELSIISVDTTTGKMISKTIKNDFAYIDQHWRAEAFGDLARVNKLLPKGKPIAIPPSLLPLIALGQRFTERSGGLFDPAMGKLLELWGFHDRPAEHRSIPSSYCITDLLNARPRMQNLKLKGIMLRSDNPKVKLDFIWMLRGYAVDLAIARLREFGIRSGTVKVGGVVRVIGNRDGQPWRVPIHRPLGEGILGFADLFEDESIVTIGSHERSFLNGGRRYNELIDPRTGYPATETIGVAVLHRNAVTADAAAHAIFIAGPRMWERVAYDMKVSYVLLVTTDNNLYMTHSMSERLELIDESQQVNISQLPNPAMD